MLIKSNMKHKLRGFNKRCYIFWDCLRTTMKLKYCQSQIRRVLLTDWQKALWQDCGWYIGSWSETFENPPGGPPWNKTISHWNLTAYCSSLSVRPYKDIIWISNVDQALPLSKKESGRELRPVTLQNEMKADCNTMVILQGQKSLGGKQDEVWNRNEHGWKSQRTEHLS